MIPAAQYFNYVGWAFDKVELAWTNNLSGWLISQWNGAKLSNYLSRLM